MIVFPSSPVNKLITESIQFIIISTEEYRQNSVCHSSADFLSPFFGGGGALDVKIVTPTII
jgi:hypothetical protein